MTRLSIPDFQIANPIYRGSSVTFYTVDPLTSERTETKATLYEATTGTNRLLNPQVLDDEGKFSQPVYIDEAVIGVITGLHVDDHDTGIIGELTLVAEVQNTVATYLAGAAAHAKAAKRAENAATEHRLSAMSFAAAAAAFARDARRRLDIAIMQVKSEAAGFVAMAASAMNRARVYMTDAGDSATAAAASEAAAAASAAAAAAAVQGVMWRDVVYKTSADSPLTLDSTYGGKLVVVDCTGGAVSITLPQISGLTLPWSVGIKKADAGANAITVGRAGTDTIGGATSITMTQSGEDGILVADDSAAPDDWTKIGFYNAPGSASEGTAGVAELATQTETDTGTDDARIVTPLKLLTWVTNKLLATAWSWTKAQRGSIVTVSYNSGSPAIDFSLGNNFRMTFGAGNAAFTASNITDGQSGMITLVQDGTGSRTATWSSDFLGDADVTLSTTASARDHVPYYTENTKVILGSPKLNPT